MSLVLGLLGGFAAWKWPQLDDTLTLLAWLIPLVALIFFMFMGMLVASYYMHKEQEERLSKMQAEFALLTANPQAAEARRELDRIIEVGRGLMESLQEAHEQQEPDLRRRVVDWGQNARDFVHQHFPRHYGRVSAVRLPKPKGTMWSEIGLLQEYVREQIHLLDTIRKEFAQAPTPG